MIRRLTYVSFFLSTLVVLAYFILPILKIYAIVAVALLIFCALIIVLGVFKMRLSFFTKNVCDIAAPGSWVALTFDDGPHPETERLLNILDKYNAKASFFCIGKEAEKYPQTLLRIQNSGHTIGTHTYSHSWKYTFSAFPKVKTEITKGIDAITSITGNKPKLFRPPFGITNPIIGKAIKVNDLLSIGWNCRTFDTIIKNKSELFQKVAARIKPGSIILLHDRLKLTVDAMPQILDEIRRKGLNTITLDEALKKNQHE